MEIRQAVFAGSWYPSDPAECERQIRSFITEGKADDPQRKALAGIVPHAGWYYSGSIACNVIRALQAGPPADTIVLFGMHLHPGSPRYLMTAGAWETPFGSIEIDRELAGRLSDRFSFEIETPRRFSRDNTIELQLPFVKYFFPNAGLVPLGVPPDPASLEIGRAVVEIASQLGEQVKVIGSTDLTHYGFNYGFTAHGTGESAVQWVKGENDRRIIEAMLAMEPESVIDEAKASHNACCAGAAATTIASAQKLGATRAEKMAYATSYDKSPGDSFVGYVGILFE
ncbi:MAG: dioxygenase [Deltaproteobacteria bacterium SG8_13]|nr:MAG: dioxygenase [Deltaproteobacteria bacterium SG8_13]